MNLLFTSAFTALRSIIKEKKKKNKFQNDRKLYQRQHVRKSLKYKIPRWLKPRQESLSPRNHYETRKRLTSSATLTLTLSCARCLFSFIFCRITCCRLAVILHFSQVQVRYLQYLLCDFKVISSRWFRHRAQFRARGFGVLVEEEASVCTFLGPSSPFLLSWECSKRSNVFAPFGCWGAKSAALFCSFSSRYIGNLDSQPFHNYKEQSQWNVWTVVCPSIVVLSLSLSLILLSRACKKREHVFRNVVEA